MNSLDQIQSYFSNPTLLLCALAGFGLFIGILTGLFGVGGGFMIVPLLNILFGIDYSLAVGSSLCLTIGNGATGTARHWRLGNVEIKSMIFMAVAAVIGAVFGAMLQDHLKHIFGNEGKDNFKLVMHALFIVMLLLTAWLVLKGSGTSRHGKSLLQRLPIGPKITLHQAQLENVSLPGICLIGLGIGILKGLMGIGGGVLFVPILIVIVGLNAHQAVGTSLGVVLFSSIAGTIKHGLKGNVNLWIAMSILAGSVVGVQIGAYICHRLHATRLRRYFAVLVLLVALVIATDFFIKLGNR